MAPMMSKLPQSVDTIAFDADDTLWFNEVFFAQAEKKFTSLMKPFLEEGASHDLLFQREVANLRDLGFGVKAFVISMIETAIEIAGNDITPNLIQQLITIGKEMLHEPVELMENIEHVLESLHGKYSLIVLTKGDLLDQERKMKKSGLMRYFDDFRVMSDKKSADYQAVFRQLKLRPEQVLMIGNSMKSDIIPLLEIGSCAVHIPFHTVWKYEQVEDDYSHPLFSRINSVKELLNLMEL